MKAQMNVEFIFMLGLGLLIAIAFSIIISDYMSMAVSRKADSEAFDLGRSIVQEFLVAQEVRDGYTRNLEIPSRLQGFDIYIADANSTIILNYSGRSLQFIVPAYQGELKTGKNLITKADGVICVNC